MKEFTHNALNNNRKAESNYALRIETYSSTLKRSVYCVLWIFFPKVKKDELFCMIGFDRIRHLIN